MHISIPHLPGHPNRITLVNEIIEAFGQQRRLPTISLFNEAPHRFPPQESRENHNSGTAFSHSQGQSKAIAIENDLRGTLRNFGLKVGMVGKVRFEARIQELIENQPDLAVLVEPLLIVRRVLREQIVILHRRLLAIVRDDEVCRRLMTTPGVGPVVALTYRATVDVPARFRKSKSVGAVFGLTCSRYQSGEIDWSGKISRCGDEMMRTMLYEAAQSTMHSKKWSWLKAWAMQIARRRGMKKAIVALARRLAVIMHRIWVDGTEFRWTREQAAAAA